MQDNSELIKKVLNYTMDSFVLKNSQNTMGVVYFRKALVKSISKMMTPGVKFKNVENLI